MSPAPAVSAFAEQPHAQPLLAWSTAQQRCLQEILRRTLVEWQSAWLPAQPAAQVAVDISDTSPTPASDVHVLWHVSETAGSTGEAAALHALRAALFGPEVPAAAPGGLEPVIAPEVARAAWSDWLQRLQSALGAPLVAATTEEDRAPAPWSGALRATLPWCGIRYGLALPGAIVQRILQTAGALLPARAAADRAPALVNLADALRPERLTLRARLQDVTLTLGELEHLAPGDVVLLPHPLDAPLRLTDPNGAALCEAWLGQQAGRVALELSPLTTPPHDAVASAAL